MASESSFDIVSEFDRQELVNALDQTKREILNRYDFKGSKTSIELEKEELVIVTEHTMHLESIFSTLVAKAVKRGLSSKVFDRQPEKEASGSMLRQEIKLRQGLTQDAAKEIVKRVKEEFKKIKISIQGDEVRVSDKSKDVLQEVINFLHQQEDLDYPVQCKNFR